MGDYGGCAGRGAARFFLASDELAVRFTRLHQSLDERAEAIRNVRASRGLDDPDDLIEPECDPYTLIVHRLSAGDVTKQEMIWNMREEDVQMALYLKRVDQLNEEWAMLMSVPDV